MISQVQLLANGCQHFPTSSLFSCGTQQMRITVVQGYNSSVWKACSVKIDDRPVQAGYKPSKWSAEYILSLQINHPDEVYREKVNLLEENVRNQFFGIEDNAVDGGEHLHKLEEIDFIMKLGLGHRFRRDIKKALEKFSLMPKSIFIKEDDLYKTALHFRMARQNGLQASQDVFKCYIGKNGLFDSKLSEDVEGMLALYEASHLAFDGEEILEEARGFATLHLKNHLNKGNIDKRLANQVRHALELPLHRRVQTLEARRYIQELHSTVKNGKNATLLELARLEYNFVQAVLQSDLQEMSRWWKEMGLSKKLSFARDRPMECFFWATAIVPEPHFKNCRKALTKICILITIIDDVYDVYGSLDELELFTHAVERWDLNCINDLPEYMKLCFLSLYNTINEMAFDVLKETGVNVTQLLAKQWADLCTAFLVEARWFHAKQMPSFDDYLSNGWLSVSGPLLLMHAFCLTQRITTKTLESYQDFKNFMRWPSTIFRLCNDLATYSAELARGESASSVLCYMNDTGVSEAKACAHIRDLVEESWMKMNSSIMTDDSIFTKSFVEIVMNLGRVVHCVYQHGDGHGAPDKRSTDKVMSLIINPISPQHVGDWIPETSQEGLTMEVQALKLGL